MKKKINIAICINLVDNLKLDVKKTQNYLEKKSINFQKKNQSNSHITLCIGQVNKKDLNLIIVRLREVLATFNLFKIKTNGLGLFLKDNINLHIRWNKNKNLIKLKNSIEKKLKSIWKENLKYNNRYVWIPKTSLAYKDLNYLSLNQIDFSLIDFNKKEMYVKEVSIIEFNLNKKEKVLKEIVIGVNK